MTTQMFQRKCLNCDRTYPPETLVCEDDGTQLAAMLTKSLVGDTLGGGKYELLQELGRGGMGVVYRARHKLMDRIVAIKMLIDDLGRDETAMQRFHVEAKAAAALNHNCIIRIYDFDISQHGFPFIVMDYLQGEPLDVFLEREKRMPWERALPLFLKVCDALGHAHRRQVVHRDIKPSNIMLVVDDDEEEKPIVLDFGIAKLFTQAGKTASRLTRTGEIFGSPLYMSPEQCLGQPIDPRSDIYSLGCLMHETLTGQAPFERSGFLQVILAHINAPAPTLEEAAPDIIFPDGLSQVTARAIEKDSTKRFESMQEFKKALADVGKAADAGGAADSSASSFKVQGSSSSSGDNSSIAGSGGGGELVLNDDINSDLKNLLNGAERGDVDDQYDLAWNYRRGEGGAPKDPKLAFYWFLKAAQQDKTQAMNCVADMYLEGEGVMQDLKESFAWYRKSAEAGDALGQWNLSWMYQTAKGCEEDPDLSSYWLRKAADQGHDGAQADLGWCYLNGYGVEESETEAFNWYLKAAEQGNGHAQTKVARALRWGWGVPQNEKAAVEWYEQAAENGQSDAQYELAMMLFKGKGCRQDNLEAQRRLRLAAQKGNLEAQNYLGLCLEFGWHGVNINVADAVSWYRKAAEQSFCESEYNLGALYEDGKGVQESLEEAFRWYRRGAEDGSPSAMAAYSRFLINGIAGEKNEAEGIKWLMRGADKEHPVSMHRLAQMIEDGLLSPDDAANYDCMELYRKAADEELTVAQFTYGMRLIADGQRESGMDYLRKAAESGHEDAQIELDKLESI